MAHPRTTITSAADRDGVLLVVTDNGKRESMGDRRHVNLADLGLRALDYGDRARVVIPGQRADLVCVCAKNGCSRAVVIHLSGDATSKSVNRIARSLARNGAVA